MTTQTESRPADAIGRLGQHWGWLLAFGILTIAAGIAALVWPGITLLAAANVFGVQLIVAGIYRLVAAFAAEESGGTRVLLALLGVLSLIIGLYAVRHVLLTVVALALLLAIPGLSLVVLVAAWLLFFGVTQTALAFRLRAATHAAGRWVASPRGAM